MIPVVITKRQAAIAEFYWGESWMTMSRFKVEEALDWYNDLCHEDRLEILDLINALYPWKGV